MSYRNHMSFATQKSSRMHRLLKRNLLIAFICLAAAAAKASVGPEKPSTVVMCRNSDTLRLISVEFGDDNRCKTIYSKAGVSQIMAGSSERSVCDKVLKNIWSNLESAKWSCHEVKQGRVSISVEE